MIKTQEKVKTEAHSLSADFHTFVFLAHYFSFSNNLVRKELLCEGTDTKRGSICCPKSHSSNWTKLMKQLDSGNKLVNQDK